MSYQDNPKTANFSTVLKKRNRIYIPQDFIEGDVLNIKIVCYGNMKDLQTAKNRNEVKSNDNDTSKQKESRAADNCAPKEKPQD